MDAVCQGHGESGKRAGDRAVGDHLLLQDLPRKVADKYDWVVRWRRARLTCQYPKGNVTHTYCLYDRHSGEDYSFGSCLSSLAAAKAQVTRMERRIREYTTWQKQNNLFFDEQTDEMLQKAVTKLKIKKENVQEAERRLQRKAEKHQREMRK